MVGFCNLFLIYEYFTSITHRCPAMVNPGGGNDDDDANTSRRVEPGGADNGFWLDVG